MARAPQNTAYKTNASTREVQDAPRSERADASPARAQKSASEESQIVLEFGSRSWKTGSFARAPLPAEREGLEEAAVSKTPRRSFKTCDLDRL